MLKTAASPAELQKHEEYFKVAIKNAWSIIDIDNKGIVDRKEISYIMRYLMQYPSEAQVRDHIIDLLEDDEPSDYIKYENFEKYMIDVLIKNEYEPNPAEHLMAAFKCLDPEGKGYIRRDVMEQLLTSKGIPLRSREYSSFE